jgi:homoprotocatechuate degradation regulator HpaR
MSPLRREIHLVDFPKTLPLALMRAREAVMRYFRPALLDSDLTDQQWRVLRTLAHYGPLEAAELARLAILLSPSLSRILRDLESPGLIARTAVETDLRRSVIRISPLRDAELAELRSQEGSGSGKGVQ